MAQSANNAYLMWRQFSGGMQKLAGTTGGVSVQGAVATPKPKSDWEGQIMGLAKNATETANLYRDQSFKQAESYMKSHSLEEYRKAAQEGDLPFKDDPIAMARLKNLHGGIASSVALRDFLDRVSANEFVGKTPQQVDAEFYKHMNESFQTLGDTYPYANGKDPAYNTGFWANGDASRATVLKRFQDVDNDWNTKQAQIATKAQLNTFLENPAITDGQVIGYFDNEWKVGSFQTSPTAYAEAVANSMQTLGGLAHGAELLQKLQNKQVPNMERGITFGSLVGDDQVKKLIYNSYQVQSRNDFSSEIGFRNSLSEHVNNKDATWLNVQLQMELKRSKGEMTPHAQALYQSVQQVNEQNRLDSIRAEREYAKQQETQQKQVMAYQRLLAMYNGDTVAPLAELGVPNEDNLQAFSMFKQNYGDIENMMRLAKNGSPDNPARTEVRNLITNSVGRVEADLQILERGQKLTGELTVPKDTEATIQAYEADPQSFLVIGGNVASRSFNDLMTVKMGMAAGLTYQDTVSGMAAFRKLPVETRKKYSARIGELQGIDRGQPSNPIKGDYAEAYVNIMAANGMRAGLLPDAAYERAKEEYNRTHINVAGTGVPIGFFSSLRDVSPTLGADALDAYVVNTLKAYKLEEKDVSARYDLGSNSIIIQNNKDGTLVGKPINSSMLHTEYKKYLQVSEAKKAAVTREVDRKAYSDRVSKAITKATMPNVYEGYTDTVKALGRGFSGFFKGAKMYYDMQTMGRPDKAIKSLISIFNK